MYIGNINNEVYGSKVMQELHNKHYKMYTSIIGTINLAGVESSDILKTYNIEDSITISKAAEDIAKFCKEFNDSPIVQDIQNIYLEQREIKPKYELQKLYEEQGLDCPDETEYDYDETKYKFYAQMSEDIGEMVGAAIKYYEKNGSFDGMTNEDMSKKTKAIEYKDLGLFVELEKEISRIDKEEFATEAEYYDALIEKIDKSDLSDKAKESIGGYLNHLKIESQKPPKVDEKNKISPEEIEKKLASIREEMDREKKLAKESEEIRRKEALKLNKEIIKMYMKNYI